MSSVFEIPLQLALVLQLAAVDPASLTMAGAEPPVPSRVSTEAFAYSDQRWFDVVSLHGARAGQGRLAARIFRTRSGLVYVPLDAERREIAHKRSETAVVVAVTRFAAADNAAWLAQELGRAPTADELCLAHLASRAEAMALITAGRDVTAFDSARPASEFAPAAALEQPALFFAGTRARTVLEVQRQIVAALRRAEQQAQRHAPAPPVIGATTPAIHGSDLGWRTLTVEWRGSQARHAAR
ncbi:MAG: hypothetical protein ACKVP7_11650 [Hyphomicrobiaceae bacterium]